MRDDRYGRGDRSYDNFYGYDGNLAHDYAPARRPRQKNPNQKAKARPKPKEVSIGNIDVTVFVSVTILVIIGVVMVASASYIRASNMAVHNNDALYFLRRNGIFGAAGMAAMFLISKVHYSHWRNFVWILYGGTIGLLIFVTIMGRAAGGATRWIENIPIIGGFQPSELAKAAIIFLIAHLVDKYPNALKSKINLALFLGLVATIVVLILIPGGFSSALILSGIGIGMIFIASPHIMRFIVPAGIVLGGAITYLAISAQTGMGFRGARINAWLDPWAYSNTTGFQIIQSLYAIASGGLFGMGIGESRQASFLPEPHNDMIFAIIVEELGLIGSGFILFLFAVFIFCGIRIAMRAPDTFSSMVAVGIVFSIALQVVVNVGVVTNTIPNTGVTLPFISYGGTSLMVSMGLVGVLLNISKYSKAV